MVSYDVRRALRLSQVVGANLQYDQIALEKAVLFDVRPGVSNPPRPCGGVEGLNRLIAPVCQLTFCFRRDRIGLIRQHPSPRYRISHEKNPDECRVGPRQQGPTSVVVLVDVHAIRKANQVLIGLEDVPDRRVGPEKGGGSQPKNKPQPSLDQYKHRSGREKKI
jgi:hypothetical protein